MYIYSYYVEIFVDVLIGGIFAIFFFLFVILIKRCKYETLRSVTDLTLETKPDSLNLVTRVHKVYKQLSGIFMDRRIPQVKSKNVSQIFIRSTTFKELTPSVSPSISDSFDIQEMPLEYLAATEVPLSTSPDEADLVQAVPHCIGVLSTTTSLTEFLMRFMEICKSKEEADLHPVLSKIKMISKCVNDVKLCLYPPLDLELVEEKLGFLIESLTGLIHVAKYNCQGEQTILLWINKCLAEIENHILCIQEIKLTHQAKSTIKTVLGSQFLLQLKASRRSSVGTKYFQDDWDFQTNFDSFHYYSNAKKICSRLLEHLTT